jgi:hypothetical protein
MTTDLNGLERKLDNLADDITGKALKRALDQAGVAGKRLADQEVRSALGDMSFSNWRRGRPIQIRTRYEHTGDTEITFKPSGRAVGPMRVLNDGRRGGNHGTTLGHHSWDAAVRSMETELPKPVGDHVRAALRKQFGG